MTSPGWKTLSFAVFWACLLAVPQLASAKVVEARQVHVPLASPADSMVRGVRFQVVDERPKPKFLSRPTGGMYQSSVPFHIEPDELLAMVGPAAEARVQAEGLWTRETAGWAPWVLLVVLDLQCQERDYAKVQRNCWMDGELRVHGAEGVPEAQALRGAWYDEGEELPTTLRALFEDWLGGLPFALGELKAKVEAIGPGDAPRSMQLLRGRLSSGATVELPILAISGAGVCVFDPARGALQVPHADLVEMRIERFEVATARGALGVFEDGAAWRILDPGARRVFGVGVTHVRWWPPKALEGRTWQFPRPADVESCPHP